MGRLTWFAIVICDPPVLEKERHVIPQGLSLLMIIMMMMTTVAMTNTLKNEEGGPQKICVPTSCQRPLTTECKHCKTSFATTLIKIQQQQKIENTKTQSEIRIL